MGELPDDRALRVWRKDLLKRFGVLFTCLLSRTIHLETAAAVTTNSFINAIRRFHWPYRHHRVEYQGPGIILKKVQSSNYLILGGSDVVANYVWKSGTCGHLAYLLSEQKMADLSEDRDLRPSSNEEESKKDMAFFSLACHDALSTWKQLTPNQPTRLSTR